MGSTERFSYEWNKYPSMTPEYEFQFLNWISPLGKKFFKGKTILDAGCGMGRNTYWPIIYGAKKVVAFDFDKKTVRIAKNNLSNFKQAEVLYRSIYNIPYQNYFDLSFSIGVIHHLEKPEKAIENLIKATKKNGFVLIWVYGYEGNEWLIRYLNPIRKITSRMPLTMINLFAYFLSLPFYFFLHAIPQKKPYLKQISAFKFWHLHTIVFDQLIPKIANYWTKEEALALFDNKELTNVKIFNTNNMSWTIIANKK